MRIELYSSGNRIISPENQNFYNVSITLHGLLMIFFLVMPIEYFFIFFIIHFLEIQKLFLEKPKHGIILT
jgi:heme/copper-type cytochrome/quinol oxidase subunit 1